MAGHIYTDGESWFWEENTSMLISSLLLFEFLVITMCIWF